MIIILLAYVHMQFEMCPVDTDVSVEDDILRWTKGNYSWSYTMILIISELEQDNLLLSIVSKFNKVPFELLELGTLHRK